MKTKAAVIFSLFAVLLVVSGCAIKTHSVYEDRKDQDLSSGNRGFVSGAPAPAPAETPKREIKVVEIELFPWLHKPSEREAERARKEKRKKAESSVKTPVAAPAEEEPEVSEQPVAPSPAIREYKVQPNDTLQKISQKFYGTYGKWRRIYDANADVLRDPNRLRVGQVLKIPADPSQPAVPQAPEKLK
jgi:LysM repeat protein